MIKILKISDSSLFRYFEFCTTSILGSTGRRMQVWGQPRQFMRPYLKINKEKRGGDIYNLIQMPCIQSPVPQKQSKHNLFPNQMMFVYVLLLGIESRGAILWATSPALCIFFVLRQSLPKFPGRTWTWHLLASQVQRLPACTTRPSSQWKLHNWPILIQPQWIPGRSFILSLAKFSPLPM